MTLSGERDPVDKGTTCPKCGTHWDETLDLTEHLQRWCKGGSGPIACRTVADLPRALVPYFEMVTARLAECYEDWPETEDECADLASRTIRGAMPKGAALFKFFASSADLRRLEGPGGVAPTIGEIVGDVFCDALCWPVDEWMNAVDAARQSGRSDAR